MYCKKCGTQIDGGSLFCPKCGEKLSTDTGTMQGSPMVTGSKPKPKKKKRKIVLIVLAVLVILGIAAAASGGGDSSGTEQGARSSEPGSSYIEMIQNGYLGEYTDVTVKELLEADVNLGLGTEDGSMKLTWNYQEADSGDYVGFTVYPAEETLADGTTVLFKVWSDDTFQIVDYGAEGDDYETTEIAYYANSWYENWYLKNAIDYSNASEDELMEGMQKLVQEKFNNISGTAVLYGASAAYTGDRSSLYTVTDQSEPINLSVTELINYYSDNELDIYNGK